MMYGSTEYLTVQMFGSELSVTPDAVIGMEPLDQRRLSTKSHTSQATSVTSNNEIALTTLPCVDYVLVYDKRDVANVPPRICFERRMKQAGLRLEKETVANNCFVKIYCPFDRLCYEAEQAKLEMPLKGCDIIPPESSLLSRYLAQHFVTDDEVDYVSGPFETQRLAIFEGSDNELTFFRSSLRSLMVHHILNNLPPETSTTVEQSSGTPIVTVGGRPISSNVELNGWTGGNFNSTLGDAAGYTLPKLLLKGIYADSFLLHDRSVDDPAYTRLKATDPEQYETLMRRLSAFKDPRRELNRSWTRWLCFQPLWKIRNYLGEQIAFYFAWQGVFITFLWLPALIGLGIFIWGVITSVKDHQRERTSCRCVKFDTASNSTICDPNKISDQILHAVDILRHSFNTQGNALFSFFICIWGAVFLEMWKRKNTEWAYAWDCNNFQDSELDRPEFYGTHQELDPITKQMVAIYPPRFRLRKYLLSSLIIILMMVFVLFTITGAILVKIAVRVYFDCDTDGSRLHGEPPTCADLSTSSPITCFLLGTLFPAMFMAWSTMMWENIYERVAKRLTNFENHQTESEYHDGLILKLFAFQFVNHYAVLFYMAGVRPQEYNLQRGGIFGLGDAYRDTCAALTCTSTLALQVMLLMIAKPSVKFCKDIILPWILREFRRYRDVVHLKRFLQHAMDESSVDTPTADDILPSTRLDGLSYLAIEWRKPPVGNFSRSELQEKVMQFGYIVMFAAAFPLAPLIALAMNFVDVRIDARRLLWFNRRPLAVISSDIGIWLPILRFLLFFGVAMNGYLVATQSHHTQNSSLGEKVTIMVLFENFLMLLLYVVDVVIPDIPFNIKMAIRRERYQVAKIMQDGYIPRSQMIEQGMNTSPLASPNRAPSCNSIIEDDIRREMARRRSVIPNEHRVDDVNSVN